ncbi:helix-turn-helix transcriptional regulator [Streptomyces palmae]|uniref:LuxR family transcriptional regulator n=1 Tax=Streptomyces palmae TaxID=1701085 RepID=A0A4Z0HA22_9ACTN|nr:LuxR family transcriptional regulator [Streptomyces palmae]TGB14854.1 LuxR family transcriptional regulator [Streptomyces palmae]
MDVLAGRDHERAAVAELLTGVRSGTGRALVVRGDAGVGKSALLRHAADRAAPVRVLRATGAEPETGLAFAALHQLLRPVAALTEALPDGQRDAVRAALGLPAPAGAPDRFLVSAGVLSLLTEAAEPRGLLCVLDDFHWMDRASADALLFAARRLDTEGVGLLIGTRDTPEARHLLRELPEVRPGGLGAADATAALVGWTGVQPAPQAVERLTAATGGNPLAMRETAELLTAEQLTGREPLPEPLPIGDGVHTVYGAQIARLPADTRRLLLVAALEGRGDPHLVLGAAARLGVAPRALDAAEAAGLVSAGTEIAFRHPLIRSAVPATASPADRRAVHQALAALLDEAGDADRRARHRAAAALGPDEEVAADLAAAAQRARDRGGYADAADTLSLAARLTPERGPRARRLADAAAAAWLGGRPGQARTALAAAEEIAEDPAVRTELARLRGRFELTAGDAAQALRIFHTAAEQAAEQAVRSAEPRRAGGAVDAAEGAPATGAAAARRAVELLADAAEAASAVGDADAGIRIGRLAGALPGPWDRATAFLRDVLAGCGALQEGDAEQGVPLLRRALSGVRADEDDAATLLWAAAGASLLGEGDAAAGYGARAGTVARVSGMTGTLPVVLENTATAERMNSRFALSAALSTEGLALATASGADNSAAAHLANLAVCAAVRGREEECREYARRALAIAIPHRLGLRAGVAGYALGILDLAGGRYPRAHERFTALTAAGPGAGHPIVVWGSAGDRVEAAMAAGDEAAAREAVAFLERWSAHANSPRPGALLARCRALVADDDSAVPLYQEALRLLAADPGAGYDRARTGLLLGERLRRDRRVAEARRYLREAAEAFRQLGAEPWERRARGELRAAGETAEEQAPTALAALTAQELRIARLVAEGASNREVAARLFLSPRTVEYHLYKVYPKLGIASRTELARLLAEPAA